MDFLYILTVLIPFLILMFSSLKIVNFNDKTLFFGVRLPIDFQITDELQRVKYTYKKDILISFTILAIIISIVYFLVPEEFSISVSIIGILLFIFDSMISFKIANQRASQIKKRDKWSGYSKNIVVVDLNYRKTSISENNISSKLFFIPLGITILTALIGVYSYNISKNEMIPGVFGESGVIKGYVKRGDIISIWDHLTPLLFQILILLIIYFSYIMIVKSKQIINGGEVEKLKIYNIKVKNAGIYYTALLGTIVSLFLMSFYLGSAINSSLVIIAFIVCNIVTIVIYSIYYNKVIKRYKLDYEVKDNKMVINRDDDKNYVWGMFYNNPSDPSLFIPKRIGVGYDFNYGDIKIRIGVSIFALFMTIVLGFVAFVLPFDMKDKTPVITKDTITINSMYKEVINKKDISDISIIKSLPGNLIKSNGGGTKTKFLGNFIQDRKYKAKLFIGNSNIEVIKILKKDASLVYINHTSKISTEKLYNTLKSYIGK
ncbi:DUF5808 domain-containing protein [Clostridium cylindrosporum]|uniref:DUF5808 domain-containing protein n=1 Tax=Clostridium cylindrosporum DSM 605 TaxID=1121307 RepID=A0A0J8G047_CLOCY|nr:DUF5808 domain-containing protein [Clostridium cylindrosporum]KMT21176.1 hypothetical protein CLCY_1c04100 [Clostridium cylindrosporum DSM 605]